MSKYTNVVRFKVKSGLEPKFEDIFKQSDKWPGMIMHILAKTGDQTYVAYGLWEDEDKMRAAMPDMISLLDQTRDMLEELSPELGVTDPVSGNVIFES
jgi:quinol monooxygenase YgiN